MSTFIKSYNSIAGYTGAFPESSDIISAFKSGYPVYNGAGGANFNGAVYYDGSSCYFDGQFTPNWVGQLNVGSSPTPLYGIQLDIDGAPSAHALIFGLNNSNQIAWWIANPITPSIPEQLRFEWEGGGVSELTYIGTYGAIQPANTYNYTLCLHDGIIEAFFAPTSATWDWWADNYWLYPSCATKLVLSSMMDKLKQEVNIFGSATTIEPSARLSSPDYGTPSTEEGYGVGGQYGTFDDSSDTISLPTAPAVGMTSTGFVNVYEISQNALTQFGSELFPNLSFTPVSQLPAPTDVTTALENIATVLTDFGNQIPNMIDMYINNTLINYILDCHILPVAPQSSGTSNIKVGFRTFTPLVNVVTSDYVDFDCGSLNIGEYYGNFIDYAPYTTAKLFLPFVGFIEVLPEFWQAGTLSITYRFNIIDGSFMAFIKSTSSKSKLNDTVIAQYGGNVCVHIPITGANYSNMITGLVGAVGGVATHGAGASSIVGGMASALNTVATQSGMQSSNSYNSSTAFLGIRTPYLLIERTVADFSETYDSERGLPSNISTSFSSLSGFTSSSTVHLDGITGATAEELDELSALLAGGIIL